MKAYLTALAVLAATAAPAFAGCAQGLQELDSAMKTSDVQPDVKTQLADMRAQAESLCTAGNEQEAADVIAEAEAMLAAQAK